MSVDVLFSYRTKYEMSLIEELKHTLLPARPALSSSFHRISLSHSPYSTSSAHTLPQDTQPQKQAQHPRMQMSTPVISVIYQYPTRLGRCRPELVVSVR